MRPRAGPGRLAVSGSGVAEAAARLGLVTPRALAWRALARPALAYAEDARLCGGSRLRARPVPARTRVRLALARARLALARARLFLARARPVLAMPGSRAMPRLRHARLGPASPRPRRARLGPASPRPAGSGPGRRVARPRGIRGARSRGRVRAGSDTAARSGGFAWPRSEELPEQRDGRAAGGVGAPGRQPAAAPADDDRAERRIPGERPACPDRSRPTRSWTSCRRPSRTTRSSRPRPSRRSCRPGRRTAPSRRWAC